MEVSHKAMHENNVPAETIRGPYLKAFVRYANEGKRAAFPDALELANAKSRVIASSKRISEALVDTQEWLLVPSIIEACWAGTMTGYAKPGQKLGSFIEYADAKGQRYVFPVPEEYRNEKDAILVSEHPDYALIPDGGRLVVEASKVGCVTRFPEKNGYYLVDPEHLIPTGREVASLERGAYFLSRVKHRVGPVRRGDMINFPFSRNHIDVFLSPSVPLGSIVESPRAPRKPGLPFERTELFQMLSQLPLFKFPEQELCKLMKCADAARAELLAKAAEARKISGKTLRQE